MRRLFPLLILPVLAACETPREACVNDATRQLDVVDGLIQETRGNLSRGYAIEEDQVVREVTDVCRDEDEDGDERRFFCDRTEVRDVERPVAINLGDEREKLDGLLQQRALLLSERDARLSACQALPDS